MTSSTESSAKADSFAAAGPRLDPLIIRLENGAHDSRAKGMSLLEAVAYFAGEPHSDRPQCACPVLGAYGRVFNDRLLDEERQLLRPLIPLLVGTRSTPAVARVRARILTNGMSEHFAARRDATAAVLRTRSWDDLADKVAAVSAIIDSARARHARGVMREVRVEAWKRADAVYAAVYVDAADAACAAAAYAAGYADADVDADASAYAAAYAYASAATDTYAAYVDTSAVARAAAGQAWQDLSCEQQQLEARRPVIDAAIATFMRAINCTAAPTPIVAF